MFANDGYLACLKGLFGSQGHAHGRANRDRTRDAHAAWPASDTIPAQSFQGELADKIRELNNQLAHEQVGRGARVTQLRDFTRGKDKTCVVKTQATRLLQGIRRNDTMISVYESSLTALEEMQSNLQAQRISGTTTKMLKRITTGPRKGGVDLDDVDVSLEHLEELKEQRYQLAGMMASATLADHNDDDFLTSLQLEFGPSETSNIAETSIADLGAPPVIMPQKPLVAVEPARSNDTANGGCTTNALRSEL